MVAIVVGVGMIVFRRWVAARIVRAQEKLWAARFIGNFKHYTAGVVLVGIVFIALGIMELRL